MATFAVLASAVGVGHGLLHSNLLETLWASSSLLAYLIIIDMQRTRSC